jgi:hypothetical protein
MRRVQLPYGEGARIVAVPQEKLAGVYQPKCLPALPDLEAAVLSTLEYALGGNDPVEPVSPDRNVAIPVDDVTQAVPSVMSQKYAHTDG